MKTRNNTLIYLAKDIVCYERAKSARTFKRMTQALSLIKFLAFFLLGMLIYEFNYIIFVINTVLCILGIALNMLSKEVYKTYLYYMELSRDLNL